MEATHTNCGTALMLPNENQARFASSVLYHPEPLPFTCDVSGLENTTLTREMFPFFHFVIIHRQKNVL